MLRTWAWKGFLRKQPTSCGDDMTIWWWYDDIVTQCDDYMIRWRSWGVYLKRQPHSRPSLLLTPGACSSLLASIKKFMGIWPKLHHCDTCSRVRNEQYIGRYWLSQINLPRKCSFLTMMVSLQWWQMMTMLRGFISMIFLWRYDMQDFTFRAIVIFFMQCGFAFLEAGSVR